MILEFILQTSFLSPQNTPHTRWLDKLILMLSNHEEILAHVYRMAGNLIADRSDRLSPCHYGGLADLFLQRIRADAETYGVVKFGEKTFLEYVEGLVKFEDADHLRRIISFVCSYLALVSSQSDGRKPVATAEGLHAEPDTGFVPQAFVDVLIFGLPKIDPRFRSCDEDDIRNCIEGMEEESSRVALDLLFVKKIFHSSMTFKKWMTFEMNCTDAVRDFSVIDDYYAWVVHSGKYVLSDGQDEERTRLEKYCIEVFETLCSWGSTTTKSCFECREDQKDRKEDKFLSFIYLLQVWSWV